MFQIFRRVIQWISLDLQRRKLPSLETPNTIDLDDVQSSLRRLDSTPIGMSYRKKRIIHHARIERVHIEDGDIMQLPRFMFRIHIDPSSFVAGSHPCIVFRRDDRKQLPPCERITMLRIHVPAQLPSDILECIRGQGHTDMVVLHLGGDGDSLDLRVMNTVLDLFLRRLVVFRAVHCEVLKLRFSFHRLLRYVIQFCYVIETHAGKLLQTVIELGVDLVVLGPVDPNRVPDVHTVDDGVEVLPIFVSLSEKPVDDE